MKRIKVCHLISLLWSLIPLTAFRLWLLRIHLDRCSECQSQLADREETLRLLKSFNSHMISGLLPMIRKVVNLQEKEFTLRQGVKQRRISWLLRLYAAVSAATIIILLIVFGWYFGREDKKWPDTFNIETNKTKKVSIVMPNYVLAEGQPAETFIFQTAEPEMLIIWVGRNN